MDLTATEIGERIKSLRKEKNWTLQDLCQRSGVSISTLSKIENGQVASSFDTLLKVSRGLESSFDGVLSRGFAHGDGRLTVTRHGEAMNFSNSMYEYAIHSGELRYKHMIPLIMEIKARSPEQITNWSSHEGEEFIYVVKGKILLYTEYYEPRALCAGESAYIDSKMPHGFLNNGKAKAVVLSICFSSGLDFSDLEGSRRTDPAASMETA
jgi:transcriptional regulator with XRE-family HTH domain